MSTQREEITVLVLGDGDFSYSLDLARYLASQKSPLYEGSSGVHFIATGLDSQEALLAKYKDSNFILKKLKGMDSQNLRVSIQYSTSAIQPTHRPHNLPPAQHIIFNHPHLGTENAALHARFLCHLFHSMSSVWLKRQQPRGCFHLTLATGQFNRWKCKEAADRHGMQLVDQRPFRSPRLDNGYYQHRRHQTGKSFAARTPAGSETYTFVLKTDAGRAKDEIRVLVTKLMDLDTHTKEDSKVQESVLPFACPHCEKMFREERSRKCHVKAVHGDGDKKRKRQDNTDTLCCTLCQVTDPETGVMGPRRFQSAEALKSHNLARHGKHSEIKPDWYNNQQQQQSAAPQEEAAEQFGPCDICGQKFFTANDSRGHERSFLPPGVSMAGSQSEVLAFECFYCKQKFRDQRAQKQHENFCQSSNG